jgi:hypothetical protein
VVIGNGGQAQPVSPRAAERPQAPVAVGARFDALIAAATSERHVTNGITKGLSQIGGRPGRLRALWASIAICGLAASRSAGSVGLVRYA